VTADLVCGIEGGVRQPEKAKATGAMEDSEMVPIERGCGHGEVLGELPHQMADDLGNRPTGHHTDWDVVIVEMSRCS
jgi:hypothetical protein